MERNPIEPNIRNGWLVAVGESDKMKINMTPEIHRRIGASFSLDLRAMNNDDD